MKHWMIDFETVDNKQTSKILSVGIVFFDLATGVMGKEHYHKFHLEKGINRYRTQSDDTMAWWMRQDESVRNEAFSGNENINDFLNHYLPSYLPTKSQPWGNGASFDVSILDNMYEQLGVKQPWQFWNVRDVRTIVEVAQGIQSKTKPPEGEAHHPIFDCRNQIDYVCKMHATLRNGR